MKSRNALKIRAGAILAGAVALTICGCGPDSKQDIPYAVEKSWYGYDTDGDGHYDQLKAVNAILIDEAETDLEKTVLRAAEAVDGFKKQLAEKNGSKAHPAYCLIKDYDNDHVADVVGWAGMNMPVFVRRGLDVRGDMEFRVMDPETQEAADQALFLDRFVNDFVNEYTIVH